MSLWEGIDDERAARLRKDLTKSIRRKLAGELREGIERKVRQDVRREARDELLAEQRARAPSDDDRRPFVAEVELDSYAQATMASRRADASDEALSRRAGWAAPLGVLLMLVTPRGSSPSSPGPRCPRSPAGLRSSPSS